MDVQNDKIKSLYEKGVMIQQYIDDSDGESNYDDDDHDSGPNDDQQRHHHRHHHDSDDDGEHSDKPDECPLCLEDFDATDRQFRPCKCGYQICIWCWHRVMETDEGKGRCPNCRRLYERKNFEFKRPDQKLIERDMSKQAKKPKRSISRKLLANVRVIQRNLVYAVGLTLNVAREEFLRRNDSFGAYGKIAKIVINKNNLQNRAPHDDDRDEHGDLRPQTVSAYITFNRAEAARKAIQAIDGTWLDGRQVRASFGTTKYCVFFLRGAPCNNSDCMYLHYYADEEDTFNKEDIILKNGLPIPQNTEKMQHLYPATNDDDVPKHEWRWGEDDNDSGSDNGVVVITPTTTNVVAHSTKKVSLPSSARWGNTDRGKIQATTTARAKATSRDASYDSDHTESKKNSTAQMLTSIVNDQQSTTSKAIAKKGKKTDKKSNTSNKQSLTEISSKAENQHQQVAPTSTSSDSSASNATTTTTKTTTTTTTTTTTRTMTNENPTAITDNGKPRENITHQQQAQPWQHAQTDSHNPDSILSSLMKLNVSKNGTPKRNVGFASNQDPVVPSPTWSRSFSFDTIVSPTSPSLEQQGQQLTQLQFQPQQQSQPQRSKFGVSLEQASQQKSMDLQQSFRALLPNVNINFSTANTPSTDPTNGDNSNTNMNAQFASLATFHNPHQNAHQNGAGSGDTSGMWNSAGFGAQQIGPGSLDMLQQKQQASQYQQSRQHGNQNQQQLQQQMPNNMWNSNNININNRINININGTGGYGYTTPYASWDNAENQTNENGSSILAMLNAGRTANTNPWSQQSQSNE